MIERKKTALLIEQTDKNVRPVSGLSGGKKNGNYEEFVDEEPSAP